MRKQEFHSVMRQELVSNEVVEELKSLLDRNGYSHVIRLAYLKALKQRGDDRLDAGLDEAAVHLPDRKQLYQFMQDTAEVNSEVLEPTVAQTPVKKSTEEQSTLQILQRQYLTEAVQSSILLEVDEEKVEEAKPDLVAEETQEEEPGTPDSFLDFISGKAEIKQVKEESVPDEKVISQFLSNQKREKVAFFDPERMARKSLDDKGGLVSDTLARIYINQGNFDKALSAYEQLILLYPEKSHYFAARIQKVKDLMFK